MPDIIAHFAQRGDLAHVALLLWAIVASAAALFAMREFAAAARRFDAFVHELERFNRRAHRRDVEQEPREQVQSGKESANG